MAGAIGSVTKKGNAAEPTLDPEIDSRCA